MANTALRLPHINNVQLTGYLATEPQVRFTPTGKRYLRFRVANNRRYRSSDGEWRDVPTFLTVLVPGEQVVERLKERMKKGSPIYIEGRIESRTTDGNTRVSVIARRIQVLEKLPVEEVVEEEEPVEEDSED